MCVIRELPPQQFLERLPISITWCGEGIAGLTQKVFNLLLRSDRQNPSAAIRASILAAQQVGGPRANHGAPLVRRQECQGSPHPHLPFSADNDLPKLFQAQA